MKIILKISVSMLLMAFSMDATAGYISFTGYQKKGTGPLNNAENKSDILIVREQAKIININGKGKFCIWKKGSYRAYLCSRNLNELRGRVLPAGEYTILPSVGEYDFKSYTTIKVKCNNCKVINKL